MSQASQNIVLPCALVVLLLFIIPSLLKVLETAAALAVVAPAAAAGAAGAAGAAAVASAVLQCWLAHTPAAVAAAFFL